MGGRFPDSNRTSTTGPTTSATFPMFTVISSPAGAWRRPASALPARLQGLGAADDLQQLRGDPALAGLVVFHGELNRHFLGVVGRVLHGHATGCELARQGLED